MSLRCVTLCALLCCCLAAFPAMPAVEFLEEHLEISDSVKLHIVRTSNCNGSGKKKTVILLHGFPEGWIAWAGLSPYLSHAGYCAIMPDQRGYNLSSQPSAISEYESPLLIQDVEFIFNKYVDLESGEKAWLAAHDWGGIIAWEFASLHPDWIRGLIIWDAPHPKLYEDIIKVNATQRQASIYFEIFTLPAPFPEQQLSANNYSLIFQQFQGEPWFNEVYRQGYISSYNRGLSGGLNWYRANMDIPGADEGLDPDRLKNATIKYLKGDVKVTVPTLVFWGTQDSALLYPVNVQGLNKYVTGPLEVRAINASHFAEHRVDLYWSGVQSFLGRT